MFKILLKSAVAAKDFSGGTLIDLVEFATFVVIFLIAVFVAYMIYRSKNKR